MKMIKIYVLLIVALLSNAVAIQAMMPQARLRQMKMRKMKLQRPIGQPTPTPKPTTSPQPTTTTWGDWVESLFYTKKIEPIKINEPIGGYAEETYSSSFGPGGQQKRMYSTGYRGAWRNRAEPQERSLKAFIPFTQAYYDYQDYHKSLGELINLLDGLGNELSEEYYTEDTKSRIKQIMHDIQIDMENTTINIDKPDILVDRIAFFYATISYVVSAIYSSKFWDIGIGNGGFLWTSVLPYLIDILEHFLQSVSPDIKNMAIKKYDFIKYTDLEMGLFRKQRERAQQEWEKQQEREEQRQHESQFGAQDNLAVAKNKLIQLLPGITTAASEKEIGDAYRKFVRTYHPDVTKNPNDPMSLKLKNEINPAWDAYQEALKQEKMNRE